MLARKEACMKRAINLGLIITLTAAIALAAGDKKLTIEDALAIKSVGGPQWSPNGKWLAFTINEWNRKENRRDTHIYVVSSSGGEVIKLTNGDRGESSPQWSADSRSIAFLANRDAQPTGGRGNQIWIIPVGGGEAEKITDEESGISQFRWSPDGKSIAYVIADVPKDKAEREKRKKDKFDTIVVDADFNYSHLWVVDLASKDKKRLTEGAFTAADPQWSPDSRWIAYVINRSGRQESSFTDISEDRNSDIFVIAAEGGQSRQLTSNKGPDSQPRWSPDGKWIAYVANSDASVWAAKSEVMVMAAEGGSPRSLTSSYHDSVFGIQWSPDGRAIYCNGAVGVYDQVFKVAATGGELQPVFEKLSAYSAVDLSPDGKMIAYLHEDASMPDDIWVANVDGKNPKRITDTNPQTKDFAVCDTEVIKWKSVDGFEIEGVLIKPAGYTAGRRYPLVLQIHGGPYGKFSYGFNPRAKLFASQGYAVLMPNPRGSVGYGNKFAVANVKDWGGKDYQDIMAGVDEVIKKGIADPNHMGVMGGSYGGFMTFWVVTQTDRFKAAIGHAGISDWYSFHGQSDIPGLMEYGFGGMPWTARETYMKYSPMSYVDRVKTPLMITHGERDQRVPIAQAEQYYRALKKRGVDVVFLRYPREGHGIQEPNHQIDLVGRQLEWFEKYVRPEKSQAASGASK